FFFEVMRLIEDEHIAVVAELLDEMVIAKTNRLIGGDEPRQPARRLGLVVGAPNDVIMPQHVAATLVEEFGFGLLLQRTPRHDPANSIGDFGDELRGSNQRQQTLATAGSNGTNNTAHARKAAFGDIETNLAELILMLTKHG